MIFFGRNPALMTIVDQQLRSAGIRAQGFMQEEQVMDAIERGEARMIVLGGGVEDGPRERIKGHCSKHGILVLEHSGGPQHLPQDIERALG